MEPTSAYRIEYLAGEINAFRRGSSFRVTCWNSTTNRFEFAKAGVGGIQSCEKFDQLVDKSANYKGCRCQFLATGNMVVKVDVMRTRAKSGMRTSRTFLLRTDKEAALRRFTFDLERGSTVGNCFLELPCDIIPSTEIGKHIPLKKLEWFTVKQLASAQLTTPVVDMVILREESKSRITLVPDTNTPENVTRTKPRRRRFTT